MSPSTPGVRAKSIGSSLPEVAKRSSSGLLMFSTANGELFGALTAFTTTSLRLFTRVVSSLFCSPAACEGQVHAAAKATPMIFFIFFKVDVVIQ